MILFLIIFVAIIALLIVVPAWRERFVEALKTFSDTAIVSFLRATSRFGAELTEEGKAEQVRWREQIVILGGGSGGVVAATKLARALGDRHDVILVDRRPEHVFMPGFLFLLVGQREPEQI